MSSISYTARPAAIRWHPLVIRYSPVVVVVVAIVAIWYVAAVLMNMRIVRDQFERDETPYTLGS